MRYDYDQSVTDYNNQKASTENKIQSMRTAKQHVQSLIDEQKADYRSRTAKHCKYRGVH